ncbi:MAG: hypothetical protein VX265_13535, partial [Myxococcota bacterium]|nr:hypothetical protein [Myxococcota bacterium]
MQAAAALWLVLVGALAGCTAAVMDGSNKLDSAPDAATDTASAPPPNTAPAVASPSLSPATVYTDDTLSASVTASDAEGDPLTLTYAWYVDGSRVQDGADRELRGVSHFDKDQTVFVIATADDGTDTTSV